MGLNKDGSLRTHGPTSARCSGGRAPAPRGVDAKADAYIAEGRVTVESSSPTGAVVSVRGSAEVPYECRWNGASWTCTCEARTWRCTHVVASARVTGLGNAAPRPVIQQSSELDTVLGERIPQVGWEAEWLESI